jgi:DNA replication protein
MKGFTGFPADDAQVEVPASFFSELLPTIEDLVELKVILFLLRDRAQAGCSRPHSLENLAELCPPQPLDTAASCGALKRSVERAAARGSLIEIVVSRGDEVASLYVLNDERGRLLAHAVESGQVDTLESALGPAAWRVARPNIFALYEQNVGLLQPLIAEELREAERTYPRNWIEEAFRIAVERNVRNWRYVRAILERWAREGKRDAFEQGDSASDDRRYVEGKYDHLIKR